MSQTAQILQFVGNIELPEHTMVATTTMVELISEIDLLKKQQSALKKAVEAKIAKAKAVMGKAETLVSKDGLELATWRYNKDSIVLDEESLMLNFRDIYDVCLVEKKGARVFNVK